jgi:hypothetical protein
MTIGFKINGHGISAEPVLADTRPSGARTHVVINEAKLSVLLLDHTQRVVHRVKGVEGITDDDSGHLKHDPVEFIRARHNLAPQGCYLYLTNEPDSVSLVQLNDWTQRAVAECVKLGRRPVAFNFPFYHPLQGAAAWRVIKPAALDTVQAGGLVGVHIYFNVLVSNSLPAFHVIQDIRDVLGDVPIVVTEYGCAAFNDAHEGWQGVLSEDQYAEQLIEGVERFGDPNVDWCIFLYGSWSSGTTYEITHAETLKRRIAEFNRRQPVTQTSWQPRRIVPTGNFNVNIRASANTNAPIVGKVPAGGVVADLDTNTEWSGEWHRVRLNGVIGFVSAAFVTVERIPDPPAQTPVFSDLPVAELLGTPELRRQHAQLLRLYADYVEHGAQET